MWMKWISFILPLFLISCAHHVRLDNTAELAKHPQFEAAVRAAPDFVLETFTAIHKLAVSPTALTYTNSATGDSVSVTQTGGAINFNSGRPTVTTSGTANSIAYLSDIPSEGNFVTLDTDQWITGKKGFTNPVTIAEQDMPEASWSNTIGTDRIIIKRNDNTQQATISATGGISYYSNASGTGVTANITLVNGIGRFNSPNGIFGTATVADVDSAKAGKLLLTSSLATANQAVSLLDGSAITVPDPTYLVTTNTIQTINSSKTFTASIMASGGINVQNNQVAVSNGSSVLTLDGGMIQFAVGTTDVMIRQQGSALNFYSDRPTVTNDTDTNNIAYTEDEDIRYGLGLKTEEAHYNFISPDTGAKTAVQRLWVNTTYTVAEGGVITATVPNAMSKIFDFRIVVQGTDSNSTITICGGGAVSCYLRGGTNVTIVVPELVAQDGAIVTGFIDYI